MSEADRHSEVLDANLIEDPAELARAEARNALRQYDVGMEILSQWLRRGKASFQLRFTHLLTLNRIALEGVRRNAGTFRTLPVRISNSEHQPPEPTQVPFLVEDLCEYINEKFHSKSAYHLAAYALWRLNWIHPFEDGNGRTARIVSYIVLLAKLGCELPGTPTIPEQIVADKKPYYAALEAADKNFTKGIIDLSEMESLIASHLATQLLGVHDAAAQEPAHGTNVPATLATVPLPSEVEYRYRDTTYSPVYFVSAQDVFRTAGREAHKNFIERNPVLVTALSSIIASIVGAVITWILTR